MLDELTSSPIPEMLLLLGGLIAIVIGIVGKNKKTVVDEVAIGLGFIVGAVMILLAVLLYLNEGWPALFMLVTLLLGIGLFFKVFKKVPVALLLALILGGVIAYFLYVWGADDMVILIGAIVVIVIVYLITRLVEGLADLIGKVLGLRPVLIALGLLALAVAVMELADIAY